jgi:hypothetical protein
VRRIDPSPLDFSRSYRHSYISLQVVSVDLDLLIHNKQPSVCEACRSLTFNF